ncbi:MAG: disulfide bond formation protein DsbA [bacterium TMED88]|nr:disulfide bond formation protein DsbA [Deltaproteobacteria bacterium]OUV23449.1 MAG: disulfide bond formation protein DsbA [bacterium TMED88]
MSQPTLSIDLFWSFRSPYSYLATGRLVALQSDFGLEVNVRPVLPIAVRTPEFFERVNPLFPSYLVRDVMRLGEFLEIPIRWPRPDPVVMNPDRTYPLEQPYIHRLTRLGVAAAAQGQGLAFLDEVSKVIWDGSVEGWHEGSHLAEAAARAGLDLMELDRTIEGDPDYFVRAIEENQQALEAAGHWGVPTMVFNGEPFFGQDRIDLLIWRLQQAGSHAAH